MSGCSQDDSEDQKYSGCDYTSRPTYSVDEDTEEEHSEDLPNKIGIREPSLDHAGHAVLVSDQFRKSSQ
jgi:hypothetical protein